MNHNDIERLGSVAAVAKALVTQYSFDPDIAYLASFYGRWPDERCIISVFQALARMGAVKDIPDVPEEAAEFMLNAYTKAMKG